MIQTRLAAAQWAHHGSTRARGYGDYRGRFIDTRALAALLDACATEAAWQDAIREINGCFAVVTEREGKLLAAVDRIRSIPLFYAAHGVDWFVGDDAYRVLEWAGSRAVSAIAEAEFCLTGYVTGDETLYASVRQIRAGAALLLDPARGAQIVHYYKFHHGNFTDADTTALIGQLEAVHNRVFRRLLASAEGRPIVLPLSGGYDSRLIAVSLRDLGAKDVVCYSYGVPGNWESRISKEVAEFVGFRWEFVPYSAERWRVWQANPEFHTYFRNAGNLASVPHLQDWPAVFELRRERRIPMDSVFVPGHSGDFLAGSHIPKWFMKRRTIRRRELLEAIWRLHYSLWDSTPENERVLREELPRRIESIVGPIADCGPEEAADLFEKWDLEERQAKFICNSLRVYESFGFEWRLPLFDAELMDFWARIPVGLRVGRRLYFQFVAQKQSLPVTEANQDHGAVMRWLIGCIDAARLRPVARRTQYALRKLRWEHEYLHSPLAWCTLVDREFFRRTYTGKEGLHSYMTLRYRDWILHGKETGMRTDVVAKAGSPASDQGVS
jgi:asparagine synthase (glutamine-hydrolysing)